MAERLKDVSLWAKSGDGKLENASGSDLGDVVVMYYFGAHWCAPCRQLAPRLKAFYEKMHETGHPVEVVFVSLDRSEEQMLQYYENEQGEWLAIKFEEAAVREQLTKEVKVQGIPSLVVVNKKGEVVVERNECIQTVGQATSGGSFDLDSVVKSWRNRAGDWTAKGAAHKLGGGSAEAKKPAGSPEEQKAAKRAARLAAIERREMAAAKARLENEMGI